MLSPGSNSVDWLYGLWSLNVPFILYKKNAKDVNNNVSIRGECDIAISLYYTTNLPRSKSIRRDRLSEALLKCSTKL